MLCWNLGYSTSVATFELLCYRASPSQIAQWLWWLAQYTSDILNILAVLSSHCVYELLTHFPAPAAAEQVLNKIKAILLTLHVAVGALCKGRVRCPWHGACFNLATGDIEDFPGLDSLQPYEVRQVYTQQTCIIIYQMTWVPGYSGLDTGHVEGAVVVIVAGECDS